MNRMSDYGVQRACLKGLRASGLKVLEPNYWSILFYTVVCLLRGWPYLPWQDVTRHGVIALFFSDSGSDVKSKIGLHHVLAVLFKTIFRRPL